MDSEPVRRKPEAAIAKEQFLLATENSGERGFSSILQGAKIAVFCKQQGYEPKKFLHQIVEDPATLTEVSGTMNARLAERSAVESTTGDAKRVSEADVKRMLTLTGNWAERMIVLEIDEIRERIIDTFSPEFNPTQEKTYAEGVDTLLNQRAAAARSPKSWKRFFKRS